jgi:multidrug resistance efflux pump
MNIHIGKAPSLDEQVGLNSTSARPPGPPSKVTRHQLDGLDGMFWLAVAFIVFIGYLFFGANWPLTARVGGKIYAHASPVAVISPLTSEVATATVIHRKEGVHVAQGDSLVRLTPVDASNEARVVSPGVDVKAPVDGLITRIVVSSGQRVKPGAVLLEVDRDDQQPVVRFSAPIALLPHLRSGQEFEFSAQDNAGENTFHGVIEEIAIQKTNVGEAEAAGSATGKTASDGEKYRLVFTIKLDTASATQLRRERLRYVGADVVATLATGTGKLFSALTPRRISR